MIIGRWKWTKSLNREVKVDGKYVAIYTSIPGPGYLEFKENGEILSEYYDDNNMLIKQNGKFSIDSLLRFEDFGFSPWFYEFSYCNNSVLITNAFPAFDMIQKIYEREK